LEDGDRPERIAAIRAAMESYLRGTVFAPPARGFLYIERSTPMHGLRRGLVAAIDLERYDWHPDARPLIRATEGTVKERIPPRMEIRRDAPLESPHVILLVDDDRRSFIEGLGERAKKRPARYSTSLMQGAGTISGWLLDDKEAWSFAAAELERLALKGASGTGDPFLYAVGDGNHSLATAKAVWDEYKAAHEDDPAVMDHRARWALVEIENIYDEGIEFEPIHRAVFGTTLDEVLDALSAMPGFAARPVDSSADLVRLTEDASAARTRFGVIAGSEQVLVETSAQGLSTIVLQPILDSFAAARSGRSIDYLHGADETIRVSDETRAEARAVGILLPPVGKADLFSTVARSGPLPRKSFSMGEAVEKRFYLECRRLFG
jgi:hypothetical protein